MSPKLSICMPTYNRANLLERAVASVQELQDLGINLELVIGDNASTDDTPATISRLSQKYPFIRPFRNSKNLGHLLNFQLCLRRARGEFALYLADDDTLLAEEVLNVVNILDQRADLSAALLSFEMWDDNQGLSTGIWPNFKENATLKKEHFVSALNLFIDDMVLTEFFLMKRVVIDRLIAKRIDAYYSFSQFITCIECGNIWVNRRPAYRFRTNPGVTDTAGWDVAVSSFDETRAGLERCLLHLQRTTPLSSADREMYQLRIESYMRERMWQASKRMFLRGEYIKAATVFQRLSSWRADEKHMNEINELAKTNAPLACAEEIDFVACEGLNASYIALHNDREDAMLATIVTSVLSRGNLQRVGLNEAVRAGIQEKTVVLVQRTELIPATHAASFPLSHILVPEQMMLEFSLLAATQ